MAVVTKRVGDVGVILLDKPQSHHALSRQIVSAALDALASPEIRSARALVVSSTGPNFCAGANVGDLLDGWMQESGSDTDPVRLFQTLAEDPRPSVAAVEGAAVGGGFELMLSCDLAVAAENAWFSLPELGLGVIPNTAIMRLQQMAGLRTLNEMMMTAHRLDANRAYTLGIVNRLCQPGHALSTAIDVAQSVASRVAPGALAVAKRYAQSFATTDWKTVQQSLADVPKEQWQEGLGAFLEKRKPSFDAFWQTSPGNIR